MPRNRSSSLPQPLASALLLTSQKGTPAAQPFRPPPPFHAIVSRLSIGVYRNIMQPSVPETIIQTIDSIIDGILCPVWFSFNFTCDIIMKAIATRQTPKSEFKIGRSTSREARSATSRRFLSQAREGRVWGKKADTFTPLPPRVEASTPSEWQRDAVHSACFLCSSGEIKLLWKLFIHKMLCGSFRVTSAKFRPPFFGLIFPAIGPLKLDNHRS
uniref:Uncharacterized protein n=1 Tax=Coccidioides posadasii RMSCC 3488 TaxID=454284 RepID=A0A0J6FSN2_COCPO|nr:hypothetical protein CPAG_09667 [Coccidioides posadasii RMSCC 3488]